MAVILVVDDERGARESMRLALCDEHRILTTSSGQEALDRLADDKVDVVLLDIIMPGMDGIEVLRRIEDEFPGVETVMVSAAQTVRTAVQAMRLGAADYIVKPFDVAELRVVAGRAARTARLKREMEHLRRQVSGDQYRVLVGESPAMRRLREQIGQVVETTATVLITGESGTGKELVARRIHLDGLRANRPFVPIHCGAIPEALLESELFGHERGAFTGATTAKKGKVEIAHGGTLFLDEIGEMDVRLQAKLLRVLQDGEFQHVGGTTRRRADVRVIASTNRDLEERIEEGLFREDLYFRLNVIPIRCPPLRERREDIPLLAEHFLGMLRDEVDARSLRLSKTVVAQLAAHDWPGNVRELCNVIERAVVLNPEVEIIDLEHLPVDFGSPRHYQRVDPEACLGRRSLHEATSEFERILIERALQHTGRVQTKASELLGTTRRVLRYKMRQLGIDA